MAAASGVVNIDLFNIESKIYVRTHLIMARMYLKKQDIPKALGEIREYLYLYPTDAEGYLILGDIYFAGEKLQKAERAYRKSLAFEPDNFYAANNLGVVRDHKGDPAGARRYFKRAIIINPLCSDARRNLAGLG